MFHAPNSEQGTALKTSVNTENSTHSQSKDLQTNNKPNKEITNVDNSLCLPTIEKMKTSNSFQFFSAKPSVAFTTTQSIGFSRFGSFKFEEKASSVITTPIQKSTSTETKKLKASASTLKSALKVSLSNTFGSETGKIGTFKFNTEAEITSSSAKRTHAPTNDPNESPIQPQSQRIKVSPIMNMSDAPFSPDFSFLDKINVGLTLGNGFESNLDVNDEDGCNQGFTP